MACSVIQVHSKPLLECILHQIIQTWKSVGPEPFSKQPSPTPHFENPGMGGASTRSDPAASDRVLAAFFSKWAETSKKVFDILAKERNVFRMLEYRLP